MVSYQTELMLKVIGGFDTEKNTDIVDKVSFAHQRVFTQTYYIRSAL